jgi:hypothetical protein
MNAWPIKAEVLFRSPNLPVVIILEKNRFKLVLFNFFGLIQFFFIWLSLVRFLFYFFSLGSIHFFQFKAYKTETEPKPKKTEKKPN